MILINFKALFISHEQGFKIISYFHISLIMDKYYFIEINQHKNII